MKAASLHKMAWRTLAHFFGITPVFVGGQFLGGSLQIGVWVASCKSDDIIFGNFVSVVESSPIRNKEIC